MSVTPLRVVEDAYDHTVLYQAPDTKFKSARTPDGGKVRDFGEPYVLADVVWAGGSLIRLTAPDTWYCVDVDFDANGRFAGWKVNFQTPPTRTRSGFETNDLIVDLVVAPDRSWTVEDAEDLERAVAAGYVSDEESRRAKDELVEFIGRVERWESPFSDRRWERWEPPAGWRQPPSLTEDGARTDQDAPADASTTGQATRDRATPQRG